MKEFYKKYAIWIIALIVAIAGGLYWFVIRDSDGSNKSGNTSLSINKEVQDKCMSAVNDEIFCKFAGVFGNVGDYRALMTTSTNGVKSSADIAVASNGNSSMKFKQGDTTSVNIVSFNGATYMQDPADGQWIKFEASSTEAPEVVDIKKEFLKADFKNDAGKKEQYINKGTEDLNGEKCYKFQVIDPDNPDQEAFMWFDAKTFQLRQLTSKDGETTTIMTFTYGNTNITQPSPVKTNSN